MEMAAFFSWVAAVAATVLLIASLVGEPPKHCQYLVAVKGHPGIYGCSQYTHPLGAWK